MVTQNPTMWVQLENEDEISIEEICSELYFTGDTRSPSISNSYEDNTGSDGSIFNFTSYSKTVENFNFFLRFYDWYDFKLKCHEIYRVFNSRKLMRVRTDSEPAIVRYVRPTSFNISPSSGANEVAFTIPFDNPSGYKYSLANSDELMAYDTGVWQLYGQNIPNSEDINYHFNSQTTIQVYNASDIAIDPYRQSHELVLKMSVGSTTSGFKLTNTTNSTSWAYKSNLYSSDVLEIDGLNTFKNGSLDNNNTNFGYIKLDQGWNTIQVSGTNDLDIIFSFPFIYID